jgi:site-specific DNA-methyltransferase (adenine-specific)
MPSAARSGRSRHMPDHHNFTDRILHGDCLDLMQQLPDGSIDMVLADLPYGTSKNKWDTPIDLDVMWAELRRITKPTAAIVLTATQPFTSALVMSNQRDFRYDMVWSKSIGSGQFNVNCQPLRTHESVLVFYRATPVTYNPQMREGTPYTASRSSSKYNGRGYGDQVDHQVVNTGTRVPTTVIPIANPRIHGGHPTQKPVALCEYLIRTYSNKGDLVLDITAGSGTTAIAALNTGRRFTCMELDAASVEHAQRRVTEWHAEQRLVAQ